MPSNKTILRMLGRGLIRRCPNCGAGGIFRHWWTMRSRCPDCGIYFEREEGYWTGAMAINLIVTELLFGALLLGVSIATWPDIPTVPLLIGGLALNAIANVVFYPIAKTVWVAIDLIFHPLETNESWEAAELRRIKDQMTHHHES